MSDQKQNRWEPASPSTTPNYSWKGKRRHEAIRTVNRWEKKYPTETVRLFVEDALSVTRSPGKNEVFRAWLNEHPKPPELVPSIWAREIEASLRRRSVMQPSLEWENEYLSNGSVTEYGGLVGDRMNVPATSLNESPGQREILEALGCPVPHPAPETRAFYQQFTDNPEQTSGIIEIVFDEAAETDDDKPEHFCYQGCRCMKEDYEPEGE